MDLYSSMQLLVAIVLASFVAHPLVALLIRPMVKTVDPNPPKYEGLAMGLGNVERALYVSALFLSQPAFIVAWLGLKVAVKWHSWVVPKNASYEEGQLARAQYLLFLYGSGVSALAALFAFLLSKPLLDFILQFLV